MNPFFVEKETKRECERHPIVRGNGSFERRAVEFRDNLQLVDHALRPAAISPRERERSARCRAAYSARTSPRRVLVYTLIVCKSVVC